MISPRPLEIILFLLFIATSGFAQNDWREGFIISNSGDTTHGFIDYRDFKSNSHICYFRSGENEETRKLTPDDIFGYKYTNGKFYVSKMIPLDEKEVKVFLEFLINGSANIYFYKNEDAHYFLEKDNEIHELKNSEVTRYVDGKTYIQEKKEYVGLLKYKFQDASMEEQIQNTDLDHRSLIRAAKVYHNKVCSPGDECIIYEKKESPLKIDFGVEFGIMNGVIYYTKPSGFEFTVEQDLINYGGVMFNLRNLPGIYDRVSVQAGFLINKFYYRKDWTYNELMGWSFRKDEGYALNVPIILDYKLSPPKKVFPKIEVGINNYFISNDVLQLQHLTLFIGGSINFQYLNNSRIYFSTRYEPKPNILRFGGGILF